MRSLGFSQGSTKRTSIARSRQTDTAATPGHHGKHHGKLLRGVIEELATHESLTLAKARQGKRSAIGFLVHHFKPDLARKNERDVSARAACESRFHTSVDALVEEEVQRLRSLALEQNRLEKQEGLGMGREDDVSRRTRTAGTHLGGIDKELRHVLGRPHIAVSLAGRMSESQRGAYSRHADVHPQIYGYLAKAEMIKEHLAQQTTPDLAPGPMRSLIQRLIRTGSVASLRSAHELKYVMVTHADVTALSAANELVDSLEVLSLANKRLGNQSLAPIARMLRQVKSLKKLDLSGNCFSGNVAVNPSHNSSADRQKVPRVVLDFMDAIRQNSSLDTLVLSGNRLGPEAARGLVSACACRPNVRWLGLAGNSLDGAEQLRVSQAANARKDLRVVL
eukprot:scaffold803_cov310-Pinguiococcus_pyrenoidosus.AAC.146